MLPDGTYRLGVLKIILHALRMSVEGLDLERLEGHSVAMHRALEGMPALTDDDDGVVVQQKDARGYALRGIACCSAWFCCPGALLGCRDCVPHYKNARLVIRAGTYAMTSSATAGFIDYCVPRKSREPRPACQMHQVQEMQQIAVLAG